MYTSINNKVTESLSPMIRKLHDLNVGLLGSEVKVLRITTSAPDVMGDVEETFTNEVIDNAIIKHPFASSVQVFSEYNNITNELDNGSIDLWEILPIEMRIPFKGNNSIQATNLKRGDIIVEVLKSDNGVKLPLIMQITRINMKTFGVFQVSRFYEMTLYRGMLSTDVKTAISNFVAEV